MATCRGLRGDSFATFLRAMCPADMRVLLRVNDFSSGRPSGDRLHKIARIAIGSEGYAQRLFACVCMCTRGAFWGAELCVRYGWIFVCVCVHKYQL